MGGGGSYCKLPVISWLAVGPKIYQETKTQTKSGHKKNA
jgi:hypothetical protein